MKLTLPNFDFFTNCMAVEHEEPKKCRAGNAYTGSLGTDPQRGFINQSSFSYSVLLKKSLEGTKSFIVECWTLLPYKPGTPVTAENRETREFDGVADSLPLIEEWLAAKFDEME